MRRLAAVSAAALATSLALACNGGALPSETPPPVATAPPAAAPTPASSAGVAVPATPTSAASTAAEPSPTATPESTAAAATTPSPTASPTEATSGAPAPIGVEATSRAAYRAAIEARDGGDLDAAVADFETVRDGGGSLAPMAALRLAQTLAAADRDAEAARAFTIAIADPALPDAVLQIARVEHAEALVRLGRRGNAVAALTAALEETGVGAAAAPRWRRAELLRAAGDPLWVEDARAIVTSAAGSSSALLALDALAEAGVAVPAGEAARARYLHWENAAASAHYQAIAAAPASAIEAASAWFYLGALAERRLDNPAAIEAYTRSLDFDATGGLADDAHWWLALLHEDEGRPLDAVEHYDALATAFPGSRFAEDAALGAALALARAGEEAAAAARLRGLVASGSAGPGNAAPRNSAPGNTARAASAARWLGVLGLREAGDPLPADLDPGALGAVLESAAEVGVPIAALDEWGTPAADWEAAGAWLEARFGARPASASPALGAPDYALALALIEVGERPVARALLFGLVSRYAGEPHQLADLARAASGGGVHDVALVAASRLLAPLDPVERAAAPRALELLAYPAPFVAEVRAAASAEGIPPLLLLALVRQESAFDPEAGSTAGALGLTQVIPSTGAAIAASLGREWEVAALLDPATSLRFGAHYLAGQLADSEGDLLAALGAYNGGPPNAARWYGLQWAPGPDGYIDAVDFTETRAYLTRVIENYAWYRYLYLGLQQPALP